MSTPPKPHLRLNATCLGPVLTLNADLSKHSSNLIYAKNGTGKSFLTRALRCFDLEKQQQSTADIALALVSEEAEEGIGSFALSQGTSKLGAIHIDRKNSSVTVENNSTIFHVFSDDFVQAELRQKEYYIDGNIEQKITLDQVNLSTKDAQEKLENTEKSVSKAKLQLQDKLEKTKINELHNKAGVSRRLKEYSDISLDGIISQYTTQPKSPPRSFKDVLSDLDTLKALPSEPQYPIAPPAPNLQGVDIEGIQDLLKKITSPSTVSEEIKDKISSDIEFYEAGLSIIDKKAHSDCPFCAQSIEHPPAQERIMQYISYFADAEGKHKKDLRVSWAKIKNCHTNILGYSNQISREIAKFNSLKVLIPSQQNIVIPDVFSVIDSISEFLDNYKNAIEAKGKSPSSNISIPELSLTDLYAELSLKNNEIQKLFKNLESAISKSDLERKNLNREACTIFAVEFAHSNWAEIDNMHKLQAITNEIRKEIHELKKSQLSDNVRDRVAKTFDLLVKSFFGNKYSFDKDDFSLKREDRPMTRGPQKTLSDGEKTAIAFCYFIACLHKKVKTTSDYSHLYLVFDDPITSMSYDFVFTIAQTLRYMGISKDGDISVNPGDIDKGYTRPALLIFTHSTYFYNICITNNVIKKDSAFFLRQKGANHCLSKFDRYMAPFEQHLRSIFEVHNGAEPDQSTCNSIRCVLEAVGRFCHPDKCKDLPKYIEYLIGEEKFEIKSVLINNLSHGTYYDEVPSSEEVRDACIETIKIVERYAKGQLEIIRDLHPTTTRQPANTTQPPPPSTEVLEA